MEVDWSATDEVKEGGDGALLHPTESDSSEGSAEDFPMQIDEGQKQISECSLTGNNTQLVLIDAPMFCACWCAGAPRMAADGPRMDASGTNQLCELCGRQLHKVKDTSPCGVGRKCKHGCKPRKGTLSPCNNSALHPYAFA
jgi:hypothetical protein